MSKSTKTQNWSGVEVATDKDAAHILGMRIRDAVEGHEGQYPFRVSAYIGGKRTRLPIDRVPMPTPDGGQEDVPGFVAMALLWDLAGISKPAKGASKATWTRVNNRQQALLASCGLAYNRYAGTLSLAADKAKSSQSDVAAYVKALQA
jgi:hypothetical protein